MEVSYIQHCGSDLSVVNAARVSFNKESSFIYEQGGEDEVGDYLVPTLDKADKKLVKYLAEHQHYSPFNHTFITLRVKAPLFVARQLVKHEYMPWNEVSRRYVDTPPEFYNPVSWRKAAKDKKQGSSDEVIVPEENVYEETLFVAIDAYKYLLKSGVAPEMARMVLPQSMYTEWYWSGTLKAWSKMYNLRMGEDAQAETREVADLCGLIISEHFPITWGALTDEG